METGMVTMPAEEFANLMKAAMGLSEIKTKVALFEDFVKHEKCSISREKCAHYFGFEMPEADDDQAD